MAIRLKRGEPGEGGVRVVRFDDYTYARADALVTTMDAAIPMAGGLVIAPFSIWAGPDLATQDGPQALEATDTGYRVALAAGDRAFDLWLLIVDSLEAGTIYRDWVVEVSKGEDELFWLNFIDPATLTDPYPVGSAELWDQYDWLGRDAQYGRGASG